MCSYDNYLKICDTNFGFEGSLTTKWNAENIIKMYVNHDKAAIRNQNSQFDSFLKKSYYID